MSRTCILVVGLPLGACLCFVVYAIFVVPALEPGLRDGVDLMGGHHLQGREYLYLVYWACAGTLITLAACLGLTRLCRCQVKDFADEYATGGGGGASSSSSSSPAGRGTLLRGGHHQYYHHHFQQQQKSGFGGGGVVSFLSASPLSIAPLSSSSSSSAPPAGKQQQSVKLPSFIAAASGLSSSPSSPAAPSSALALTRTLTVQPSTNPGFVFDDDDDDNDDDDDGLPTTIRSLEEKLAAARVWPKSSLKQQQQDSGMRPALIAPRIPGPVLVSPPHRHRHQHQHHQYQQHKGHTQSLVPASLLLMDGHAAMSSGSGGAGAGATSTYSGTAGMGQRWRSMPFERGFSLAWDDDLGFDDLKLGDEPLTPEVDASISEKLRTIQTRSASKTNVDRWSSADGRDSSSNPRNADIIGAKKTDKDDSSSDYDAGDDNVDDDDDERDRDHKSRESLASSSDSFGSLLEPKRLFSVCEIREQMSHRVPTDAGDDGQLELGDDEDVNATTTTSRRRGADDEPDADADDDDDDDDDDKEDESVIDGSSRRRTNNTRQQHRVRLNQDAYWHLVEFVPDTPTTTDDGVVVEEADLFPSSSSSSSTHPPPSFLTTMTSSHIDLFPDTCSSSTSTTTGNKQ